MSKESATKKETEFNRMCASFDMQEQHEAARLFFCLGSHLKDLLDSMTERSVGMPENARRDIEECANHLDHTIPQIVKMIASGYWQAQVLEGVNDVLA